MKRDLPALLPGLLPDSVLDCAVRMPKEQLRTSCASRKGDKTLIDTSIASARVSSLRYDTCGIPPYRDGEDSVTEILVAICRLNDTQGVQRLREMFHGTIPHHLLLLLECPDVLYLSAAPAKTPLSQLVFADLSSPHPDFAHDMSAAVVDARHLKEVLDRWLCALHALWLTTHGPSIHPLLLYRPVASPAVAVELKRSLAALDQQWRSAHAALKKPLSPQARIEASKRRIDAATSINLLLNQYNLIEPCPTKN